MTKTDLAYAAGLFDGEGCITAYGRRRPGTERAWVYQMRVVVNMTHQPTIIWMGDHFGGSCRLIKAPSLNDGTRKPIWMWMVQSGRASAFLRAIRPYMVTKAEQADIALKFQDRLVYQDVGRAGLPAEEHVERQKLMAALKAAR